MRSSKRSVAAKAEPGLRRRPTAMQLAINLGMMLCALAFLSPLVIILSSSFSSQASLVDGGYSLLPRDISLEGWEYLLRDPSQVVRAYGVSILVTTVGTIASVTAMALLGYTLSRRQFRARRSLTFYVYFTMLFSGGLVPTYILVTQYLGLRNSVLAMILPLLVAPWHVLLLRTFFMQLPESVLDAAKIDGAGEWRTFFQVALPMSGAAIATIGTFTMLRYWNDWWQALLYIDDQAKQPVQLFLYRMLTNIDSLLVSSELGGASGVPIQPIRMAIGVLAVGPVVVAFVFLQKYFVRGVTIGSLKG